MKTLSRKKMMDFLNEKYPSIVIGKTEDFDGTPNGIWINAENEITDKNDNVLFDYWSDDTENREFGVIKHLDNFVNKKGWLFEWQDAGTIMLLPQ